MATSIQRISRISPFQEYLPTRIDPLAKLANFRASIGRLQILHSVPCGTDARIARWLNGCIVANNRNTACSHADIHAPTEAPLSILTHPTNHMSKPAMSQVKLNRYIYIG